MAEILQKLEDRWKREEESTRREEAFVVIGEWEDGNSVSDKMAAGHYMCNWPVI